MKFTYNDSDDSKWCIICINVFLSFLKFFKFVYQNYWSQNLSEFYRRRFDACIWKAIGYAKVNWCCCCHSLLETKKKSVRFDVFHVAIWLDTFNVLILWLARFRDIRFGLKTYSKNDHYTEMYSLSFLFIEQNYFVYSEFIALRKTTLHADDFSIDSTLFRRCACVCMRLAILVLQRIRFVLSIPIRCKRQKDRSIE